MAMARSFWAWLFVLPAISFPATAQRHSDFQVWPTVTVVKTMKKLELTGDANLQFSEDDPHFAQLLLRGIVAYRVTDRLSVGGGYTYVAGHNAAGAWRDNRIVQDVVYRRPIEARRIGFTLRTRLEERFRVGESGTSLRLRQLVRVDVPVTKSGLRAIAWNETFCELKDTGWSGPSGPALMLNFVGIGIPISRKTAIEPGYLNFTTFNPGRNRVRHVLGIWLIAHI